MQKIVECVPNISEGRDKEKINSIVSVIERPGVKLLDVSSDSNHNRTVITFAGEPETVKNAAFDLIKKTAGNIDMSKHKGEHPRIGAVDVCPFVPVSGVMMKDCVELAHRLGDDVGKVGLPGYFYAEAAKKPERKKLSQIREGEYEGLAGKIKTEEWKPDFGPQEFNLKFGAMVIGARDFLVAFNVNLKSDDLELAKKIAREVRGSGYLTGVYVDQNKIGKTRIPGIFPSVQAIDVDTRDKGYVQVSMNLNNYKEASVLTVFNVIKRKTKKVGVEIHSSELIGLAPRDAFKDTPTEYLKLKDFNRKKQIIEEALK